MKTNINKNYTYPNCVKNMYGGGKKPRKHKVKKNNLKTK